MPESVDSAAVRTAEGAVPAGPPRSPEPPPLGDVPGADSRVNRRELLVRRLGFVHYPDALTLQERLVRSRKTGAVPDTLLLLEHPHVITLGSAGKGEHVLASEADRARLGVDLVETGRGGDVTYHGPGQLVGYPILELSPDRRDLHRYLRDLEEALILALDGFGIRAARVEGYTGVWVGEAKIAAIGVRVSSGWVTSHGFALNVSTDLSYFATIVPCGIPGREVTSMTRELGAPVALDEVQDEVAAAFAATFGYRVVA